LRNLTRLNHNAVTNKVLQMPAVRTRFTATGADVLPGTPEE
jgi:hypothetical protein